MKLSYTEKHVNTDTSLQKLWHYLCLSLQIIVLVSIALCLIMISSGYMNMNVTLTFGGSSTSPPINSDSGSITHVQNRFPTNSEWSAAAAATEHTDDSENNNAREIFDLYDSDNDGLLSKDEFSNYVIEMSNIEESFTFMDKDEDDKLQFVEFLTVFQVADSNPLFEEPELVDTLSDIFGDRYTTESKPNLLCQILFQQIDKEKTGFINKAEYIQYEIDKEWSQYTVDENGFINFEAFAATVEQSITTTEMNKFQTMHEAGTYDFTKAKNDINDQLEPDEVIEGQPIKQSLVQLEYHPHELDEQIENFLNSESQTMTKRRRMVLVLAAAVLFLVVVKVFVFVWWVTMPAGDGDSENTGNQTPSPTCYDEESYVNVLHKGFDKMKNINVGDYVYDGNGYTKIFYVEKSDDLSPKIKMKKIEYGNPAFEYQITLTPLHLLYRFGDEYPVRSNDILVGDVLQGMDELTCLDYVGNNQSAVYDYNYCWDNFTVYNISNVYATPIGVLTKSGALVVNNGVKTSVYVSSFLLQCIVSKICMIAALVSDYIDEDIAVSMVDFGYKIIYKKMESLFGVMGIFNKEFITIVTIILTAFIGICIIKKLTRFLCKRYRKTKLN